jgi:hypothetical protein
LITSNVERTIMIYRRTLAIYALLSLTLPGLLAAAEDKPPAFLVGKWAVSSVATGELLTSFSLFEDGSYRGGSWGRNYGGPNGLGATRYKYEGGTLTFFYPHDARNPDIMLEGSLRPDPEGDNQYDFEVNGGYYGTRGGHFQLKKTGRL